MAQIDPRIRPYRWRLEALLFLAVKTRRDGSIEITKHDHYVTGDFPGLFNNRMRLFARLHFSRLTNLGYYGLGNRSAVDAARVDLNPRAYQYGRTFPTAELGARFALDPLTQGGWELFVGARATANNFRVYPASQLEDDRNNPNTTVQQLLVGTGEHGEAHGTVGMLWDSRDHETAPTCGMFHEASVRAAAGLGAAFGYAGANVTSRIFVPLGTEKLVLAVRAMADVLFGRPPFYELARHGGLAPNNATGGAVSIRGVPGQRYHGKIKVLGNLELRARLLPFVVGRQRFYLGGLLFVDTGRVWAKLPVDNQLDGKAVGLSTGTGAGLRLRWGETFVMRVDFATSVTGDSRGLYIDIHQAF